MFKFPDCASGAHPSHNRTLPFAPHLLDRACDWMQSRQSAGAVAGTNLSAKGKSKRAKEDISLLERYVISAPWESVADSPEVRRAKGEKYLFTFRSNVMYSGAADPNPCVYGDALDIVPNDYIKVVAVVDEYWWVGRLVGGSAVCKYVPSPKCFKEKHFTSKIRSRVESHDAGQEDGANTSQQPRRDTVGNRSSVMGMFGVEQSAATGQRGKKTFRAKSDKLKDRQFTKRPVRTLPVYDLAPDVRPLVIVGPSAPGYEVTDKMQYALVSYLLKSFSQHCVKVIVDDESAGKTGKSKSVGSGGGLHLTSEKMNEIFLIGSSGKVPILITMHQNVDALRFSPLMPIIAQVRVPSAKVLSKLIKTRNDQSGMQLQLNYTEKLNTMNHNNFDVILVHSKLDESCYELAAYVDAYLQDIRTDPVIDAKVWHAVDEASTNRVTAPPRGDQFESTASQYASEADVVGRVTLSAPLQDSEFTPYAI